MLESPRDTRGWTTSWRNDDEIFTTVEGVEYVRVDNRQPADVEIAFPRLKTPPLRLRLYEKSAAARRERREAREMKKRGYA